MCVIQDYSGNPKTQIEEQVRDADVSKSEKIRHPWDN